jgi:hypothetical protein
VAALTASFAAGSVLATDASGMAGAAAGASPVAGAGSLAAGAEFAELPPHAREHADSATAQRDDLCKMTLLLSHRAAMMLARYSVYHLPPVALKTRAAIESLPFLRGRAPPTIKPTMDRDSFRNRWWNFEAFAREGAGAAARAIQLLVLVNGSQHRSANSRAVAKNRDRQP